MAIWDEDLFRQTAYLVIGGLAVLTLLAFALRNRSTHWRAGLASIFSWLLTAPFLFILLALPHEWQTIALVLMSIWGLKVFFQLTGMFHRSYFVWAAYLGSIALGVCLHYRLREVYNIVPMAVFGLVCLIPIVRNSHKYMLQYMALTLMAFVCLGWSTLHLGWILQLQGGAYLTIYIVLLSEVFDNLSLALSRFLGTHKMFSRITPRRTWEGFLIAAPLTLVLAFAMRHLLPERSEEFWIASGLTAIFGGSLGDLVFSVIRRDLGIKDVGAFIIGRGDQLSVFDRLIFVAPIFYYVMWYLEVFSALGGARFQW